MHPFEDFQDIVTADEPMAPHIWFRLGGPAAFLARPRTLDGMLGFIRRCREEQVPFKLLTGGSNVLVRDEGTRALVIHLESPAFSDVTIRDRRVVAGAAVPLTALISQTARVGLSFAYRESSLDEPVILSAELELEREDPEAVVRRMRRIWIIKKENQPYGHQSSGCIFKNPTPDLPAGTLIEQAGLKGTRIGGAEVSDRHANFIVAEPGASSTDVLQLIDQIRQRVWQQFGYELELQLQIW